MCLGRHGELLGYKLGWDLVHGVHTDGQPVRLFAVKADQVVTEKRRRPSCKKYRHTMKTRSF